MNSVGYHKNRTPNGYIFGGARPEFPLQDRLAQWQSLTWHVSSKKFRGLDLESENHETILD